MPVTCLCTKGFKKTLISFRVWFIVCTTIVRSLGNILDWRHWKRVGARIYRLWEDGMTKWFKDVLVELHREESGQDLIEYALIAALIALAATVGMGAVATAINEAFSSIGAKLKAYSS